MAEDGIPQDNMGTTGGQTGQTATTTAQAGEFGTSDFGERMDYSKPKYQDLWAMILFYVHILIIVILCIYFWGVSIPALTDEISTDDSTTVTITTDDDDEGSDGSNTTGLWLALLASLFSGALFGMLWLQCMKMFAEMIIKILLFVQIAAWGLVVILGLAIPGGIGLVIIGLIFMAFTALYTWWYVFLFLSLHIYYILYVCVYNIYSVWSRIPFAGACLSIASQIVQTYHGTVWLSLGVVFINFIWCIIWVFAIWAYIVDVYLARDKAIQEDPTCQSSLTKEEDTCGNISNFVIFLFLVSLYWGLNVWRNVSHTTTCGM